MPNAENDRDDERLAIREAWSELPLAAENDARPPMTDAASVGGGLPGSWSDAPNAENDAPPRPRLLDLFCGAGGCSVGYARAGFDVVGVDINPMPHYPYEFHQADAMTYPLDGFDVVHASPPCQDHMRTPGRTHGTGWMLPATRDRLEESGIPWVIENVPGARMRPDFKLCGCMFGLDLRRERWFETSWQPFVMSTPCHHPYPVPSVVGHGTPSWVRQQLGYNPTIAHYRRSMGIDWMNRDELSQAIPPAYTEYLGGWLMDHLTTLGGCRMTRVIPPGKQDT